MRCSWLLAASFCGLLIACGPAATEHPGKSTVLASLKDPASAQFRNEAKRGDTFCAEVNAKNSMGGYVGFRRVIAAQSQIVFEDGGFETWSEIVPGMTAAAVDAEERLLKRLNMQTASSFDLPQSKINEARNAAKFAVLWAAKCGA